MTKNEILIVRVCFIGGEHVLRQHMYRKQQMVKKERGWNKGEEVQHGKNHESSVTFHCEDMRE